MDGLMDVWTDRWQTDGHENYDLAGLTLCKEDGQTH